MKVIIAGGRNFNDYPRLKDFCDKILSNYPHAEIVSGGAEGADQMGERYAAQKRLDLTVFHANWTKWGKAAGPRRNLKMAQYADALIAFWDGKSRGTKNMIDEARNKKLRVRVCYY